VKSILLFALVLALLAAVPLRADDGAASIAQGGLVVMGHEPRITMAKEVLKISLDKVVVDYDFRNDSDQDVTTEVAFPIPDYGFDPDGPAPASQGFDNFKLWVDGVPAKFTMEVRAIVKGKDLTQMLSAVHVDTGSLGHLNDNEHPKDVDKLSASQRAHLKQAGLIDEDGEPLWTVKKKYYWQQTFPARATVHIRHEYTPVDGGTNSVKYGLGPNPDKDMAAELKSMCVEGPLLRSLTNILHDKGKDAPYSYVDFILTTANTWKTPIEDFTLIVERPHEKDAMADYVSFCWDGPVTKTEADHFEAHAVNFVPKKELRVGFFEESKSSF
jgi:hypothetical protein